MPFEDIEKAWWVVGAGSGWCFAEMMVAVIYPAWTSPRGRRRSWGWHRGGAAPSPPGAALRGHRRGLVGRGGGSEIIVAVMVAVIYPAWTSPGVVGGHGDGIEAVPQPSPPGDLSALRGHGRGLDGSWGRDRVALEDAMYTNCYT